MQFIIQQLLLVGVGPQNFNVTSFSSPKEMTKHLLITDRIHCWLPHDFTRDGKNQPKTPLHFGGHIYGRGFDCTRFLHAQRGRRHRFCH